MESVTDGSLMNYHDQGAVAWKDRIPICWLLSINPQSLISHISCGSMATVLSPTDAGNILTRHAFGTQLLYSNFVYGLFAYSFMSSSAFKNLQFTIWCSSQPLCGESIHSLARTWYIPWLMMVDRLWKSQWWVLRRLWRGLVNNSEFSVINWLPGYRDLCPSSSSD